MLGNYYYHEIIRRTIISFGTLFNNIFIKHNDESGNDLSLIKVPIAYGPVQKFLARLEEKPDLKKRVAITLPRMSFEMTSIQYDPSRKVSSVQTFQANKPGVGPVKVYMPAPYNIGIQLSIITKYQDDMLQIIEQIIPYFQPNFNLTVDLVNSIGEKRDIPIILENISMNDEYENDFSTRRSLVYTLNFAVKTSFFGPISDSSDALIKKVQVDYHSNTEVRNSSRQLRYTVEPKALRDYDEDGTTSLAQDLNELITEFDVSDSTALQVDTYIMIDEEVMYIKEIDSNTLTVLRGQNNTIQITHSEGSSVNVLTQQDDELVEYGDDFGFDENYFDFGDGKVFSPRKGIDV